MMIPACREEEILFNFPEIIFTELKKNIGYVLPSLRFYRSIEVNIFIAECVREDGSDGGFSASHKAGKVNQVLTFLFHGLKVIHDAEGQHHPVNINARHDRLLGKSDDASFVLRGSFLKFICCFELHAAKFQYAPE